MTDLEKAIKGWETLLEEEAKGKVKLIDGMTDLIKVTLIFLRKGIPAQIRRSSVYGVPSCR